MIRYHFNILGVVGQVDNLTYASPPLFFEEIHD